MDQDQILSFLNKSGLQLVNREHVSGIKYETNPLVRTGSIANQEFISFTNTFYSHYPGLFYYSVNIARKTFKILCCKFTIHELL